MGKIILVTGGARSGKSSYAEEICKSYEADICYIATAIPFDDEMCQRIDKHKEMRPVSFKTFEGYKDFDKIPQEITNTTSIAMLDCVTIMITNLMMDGMSQIPELFENYDKDCLDKLENEILNQISEMISILKDKFETTVIVTNEIGMGIVPPNKLSRYFRDIAGRANQMIAKSAEEVYFCVSGIPMKVKG